MPEIIATLWAQPKALANIASMNPSRHKALPRLAVRSVMVSLMRRRMQRDHGISLNCSCRANVG